MASQPAFINALLDAAFNGATYTGGAITMGLFRTGIPSTTGVEVSGGGYARQTVDLGAAASKKVTTATSVSFTDLPTTQTIVAFGIYSGATLIDEALLTTPFTPTITNNELKINYSFEIGA